MIQHNNDKVVDADLDALKLLMLDTIYPVGSIYMSVNNVSPSTLFGGTWEAIQDRFLLAAGESYSGGTTGGSAKHTPSGTLSGGAVGNHTLTIAETPAHTHTRGTMEITGQWKIKGDSNNAGVDASATASGAFSAINETASGSKVEGSNWSCGTGFNFNASRSWTGETSSVGSGGAHDHPFTQPTFKGTSQNTLPPYLTVYMWKRVD